MEILEHLSNRVRTVMEADVYETLPDEHLQYLFDYSSVTLGLLERAMELDHVELKKEVKPYCSWINKCYVPMIAAWHAELTYRQKALVRCQTLRVATAFLDSSIEPPFVDQPKRRPIPPGVRFEVLHRAGHTCQSCGAKASDGAQLHIDHIHPVSKGGTNDLSNLQALCRDCNLGKGDRIL